MTDISQANHQGAERHIENNVYRLPASHSLRSRSHARRIFFSELAQARRIFFPTSLGACSQAKFPRFRQLNYLQPTRKTTHQQSLPNQRWQFKRFQLRTTKFPPPEKFSFKPEDWTRWIRRFERFRKVTGLDQKSGENQVNTLVHSMGEEADDIMVSFGLTADDAKQYELVKNRFESHFIIKRNIIFERAKFNLRSQQEGESVETFITDLHCLAEHCEFGVLKDELIRDRIVVGLKDKKLPEKIQLNPKLTLEKAVTQARQSETVKKQQDTLQGTQPDPHSANVDQISKNRGKGGKGKDQKDKPPKSSKLAGKTPETKCTRCLGTPHSKQECPA